MGKLEINARCSGLGALGTFLLVVVRGHWAPWRVGFTKWETLRTPSSSQQVARQVKMNLQCLSPCMSAFYKQALHLDVDVIILSTL